MLYVYLHHDDQVHAVLLMKSKLCVCFCCFNYTVTQLWVTFLPIWEVTDGQVTWKYVEFLMFYRLLSNLFPFMIYCSCFFNGNIKNLPITSIPFKYKHASLDYTHLYQYTAMSCLLKIKILPESFYALTFKTIFNECVW